MAGDRFPAGARNISLVHSVQADSGTHPVSYLMGTGSYFPWGEVYSSTSSAEIKKDGLYLHLMYIFMVWCLIN
jgi:hypothetical protein